MLAVLTAQSLSSTSSALAVSADDGNQNEQMVKTENSEADAVEEVTEAEEVEESTTETIETTESKEAANNIISEANAPIQPQATMKRSGAAIEDQLLSNMVITTMDGIEYSQETETRILNTTPVLAKLNFLIENKHYEAGSVYQVTLPDHLGYSDISGEVANIDASWSVDAANKQLTITFNQFVSDVQFTLELHTYIYTDNQPLVTIETPGVTKNQYQFDVYENVSHISYEETDFITGVKGNVYFNLDRTLSGSQTVELLLSEIPGAQLMNGSDKPIQVFSYDVDINGSILPETKQLLQLGADYTVAENTIYRAAVTIANMNKQKAYALAVDRPVAIESVSSYNYSFYNQYPTTKLGSVSLKSSGANEFSAKSSKEQKVIKTAYLNSVQGANFYSKGDYYVSIFSTPTFTKKGEQIILESKNGQLIGEYDFYARTAANQSANIADYFDIQNEGTKLVLTAKEDNILQIRTKKLVIPFDEKDISISVSTPAVDSGKEIMLVTDQYVPLVSIINPNNAETAWGNYTQNGAYSSDTSISIQGTQNNPINNLEIKVAHPSYLELRVPDVIYFTYKKGKDFTVTTTDEGTILTFSKPITITFNLDLGFNYVPDSLAKNVSIPVDTIPVTMKADEFEAVHSTVRTGRRLYSERTLQSSKNQFLVNARNDSHDSLVVTTKIPAGSDVLFDIYDVSNDQVDSIYPQYWDRGYYFDKPMDKSSAGYPEIEFDEKTNSYTFDFGKTSKRYIIEYKYANGWSNANTIYVTGSTAEPLNNNQILSTVVAVQNEKADILSTTQTSHATLKNVTTNTIKTKNINSGIRKVENPTFDLTLKGTTNAAVDINSIVIEGVPKDAYEVKATTTGAQIIFNDYTLTENITITYNTISKNAGQISTEATINSTSLAQTNAQTTVAASEVVLRFSEGDASGVVTLTQAQFHTHAETDEAKNIANVQFELTEAVTQNTVTFTTDKNGQYTFDSIMTGSYLIKAVNVPNGYTIDPEYLSGKAITLTRSNRKFDIPLKEIIDLTTVKAEDSTILVGSEWHPADNFIEATDQAGQAVDFSQISVTGNVDTTKAGDYEIVYHNQGKEDKAIVHVVDSQEKLTVKNSTIYVGDSWQDLDNFVSATAEDGKDVPFSDIHVTGTVDTTKAGVYDVTYEYKGVTQIAKITVLDKQTSVSAKDSTIYVGTSWQAADNFIAATDETGNEIPLSEVVVSGTVDTEKAGIYEVTYTNSDKTAVAKITVLSQETTNTTTANNANKKETLPNTAADSKKQKTYPATGEKNNTATVWLGLALASATILGFFISRKKKED